jgi:hypothetical protein
LAAFAILISQRLLLDSLSYSVVGFLLPSTAEIDSRTGVCTSQEEEKYSPGKKALKHTDRLVERLQLIFVLDPNFYLCWEELPVNETVRTTILPWLRNLKDVFTRTDAHPNGEYLQVAH